MHSNEQYKDEIKKKEVQNLFNLRRYMHPYVHCSIIYNSQDMEST